MNPTIRLAALTTLAVLALPACGVVERSVTAATERKAIAASPDSDPKAAVAEALTNWYHFDWRTELGNDGIPIAYSSGPMLAEALLYLGDTYEPGNHGSIETGAEHRLEIQNIAVAGDRAHIEACASYDLTLTYPEGETRELGPTPYVLTEFRAIRRNGYWRITSNSPVESDSTHRCS